MAGVYALARPAGANVLDFYSGIVQQLFVPTVAALIALVFGVSAFGDEREDGTILYLVATPQPRIELVDREGHCRLGGDAASLLSPASS